MKKDGLGRGIMRCIWCVYVVMMLMGLGMMFNVEIWIGRKRGKHEKQAVIMPVSQGHSCYYSALNLSI